MGRSINYGLRESIKKTSFKLFLEHGYDDVTTRNIAEACGISRALLHHYFSKKETLLLEVYLNLVRESIAYFLQTLSDEQLENMNVCLFFGLFFGMMEIKPAYKNIYLPIYRDAILTHEMLSFALDNNEFFFMRKPYTEKNKRAMFMVSGSFSQLTLLLEYRKLDMTVRDAVNYAMEGYYYYLGKTQKETRKLIAFADKLIDKKYIEEFILIFESKMN